jgi:formate-dependent nitrite reductase membrane component NrfD
MEPMIEVTSGRHNPMVDPVLHAWGWEIPVYLFLGGLVAGLLVLVAAREIKSGERPTSAALRIAPFAAIVLITLGMLALFLDLEHRSHVYRFYLALRPASPMSWGAWILLLVYPVAALLGLGSLTPEERARPWLRRLAPLFRFADARRREILWASLGVGAVLGLYTGLLLGTLAARPGWNSALLGPLFLTSGISTGAALLLLWRPEERERHLVARWDAWGIGAEILLLGLLVLGFAAGDRAAQGAARALLGGPFTGVFWSIVVGMGLLVPLALEAAGARRRLAPTVVAPLLVLVGGLAMRFVLLGLGQATSVRGL